ncbi:MAG: hypothetical protein ACOYJ4_02730, partial [Polynucleobacter sp.]
MKTQNDIFHLRLPLRTGGLLPACLCALRAFPLCFPLFFAEGWPLLPVVAPLVALLCTPFTGALLSGRVFFEAAFLLGRPESAPKITLRVRDPPPSA